MRSIAAQVISLLLLSQLLVDVVHGIRLDKESLVGLTKQIHPEKMENQQGKSANEKDLLHKCGEKCRGASKESTVRKSKQGHDHMIPTFHEDYYGPRDHKPKHH